MRVYACVDQGGAIVWLPSMLLLGTEGCTRREPHDVSYVLAKGSVAQSSGVMLLDVDHVIVCSTHLDGGNSIRFLALRDQPLLHIAADVTLTSHCPDYVEEVSS